MSSNFHKTDGALLGSCGDIRDPAADAVALVMVSEFTRGMAESVLNIGQALVARRLAREQQQELAEIVQPRVMMRMG